VVFRAYNLTLRDLKLRDCDETKHMMDFAELSRMGKELYR
jgi:hypothetical protein